MDSGRPLLSSTRSIKAKLATGMSLMQEKVRTLASGNFVTRSVTNTPDILPKGFKELPHFELVKPSAFPTKNQPNKVYKKIIKNDSRSFHQVDKVKKNNKLYFLKHNPFNSVMSVLEATICGFYKLNAPDMIPSAHAIYDDECAYTGVASKALPGFISALEDPLQPNDLRIPALDAGKLTIEELDILDRIVKRDQIDLTQLNDNYQIKREARVLRGDKERHVTLQVSTEDLRHYRIIKGLAQGLTLSYLFEEDDLHRGNMAKDGRRIDFDMSLWSLLCRFKDSGVVDWWFRFPSDNAYTITANDIRTFPNLNDAKPFYWPTKPPPIIPDPVYSLLGQFFTISENSFKRRENEIYEKLAENPVFIYHKYVTLFKFVLTAAEDYRNIAELHISKEETNGNSIIDLLVSHMEEKIEEVISVLCDMPEFKDFLQQHGDLVFSQILVDFEDKNALLSEKIARIDLELAHRNRICAKKPKLKADFCLGETVDEFAEWEVLTEENYAYVETEKQLLAKKENCIKQLINVERLRNQYENLKTLTKNGYLNTLHGESLMESLKEEFKSHSAPNLPTQWWKSSPPDSPRTNDNGSRRTSYGTFQSIDFSEATSSNSKLTRRYSSIK